VLTGFPNYPTGIIPPEYRGKLLQREEREGVHVVRSFIYASHDSRTGRRILNQLSFALSSTLVASFLCRDADVVVATSPPLFTGIPAYLISQLRRAPMVFEVRDLLPESAVQTGMLRNRALIRLSETLARFLYRKSARLIALTEGVKQGVASAGVAPERIEVITNGADTDVFDRRATSSFRRSLYLDGRFAVLYTGTFGFIHGLHSIVQAARLLKERGEERIVFVLVGDGAQRQVLSRAVTDERLTNLIVVPPQQREQMPDVIAAADACIATTHRSQVARGYIPSKMFEYMACAKPIVLGIDGEAADIVRAGEAGLCVGAENPAGIVDAVLRLRDDAELCARLGENGRRLVETQYSRQVIARRYESLLCRVVGERKS
jgi:colanic acid biosynthesis glycosyl transferase WcaI